jgi:hypothetical protein
MSEESIGKMREEIKLIIQMSRSKLKETFDKTMNSHLNDLKSDLKKLLHQYETKSKPIVSQSDQLVLLPSESQNASPLEQPAMVNSSPIISTIASVEIDYSHVSSNLLHIVEVDAKSTPVNSQTTVIVEASEFLKSYIFVHQFISTLARKFNENRIEPLILNGVFLFWKSQIIGRSFRIFDPGGQSTCKTYIGFSSSLLLNFIYYASFQTPFPASICSAPPEIPDIQHTTSYNLFIEPVISDNQNCLFKSDQPIFQSQDNTLDPQESMVLGNSICFASTLKSQNILLLAITMYKNCWISSIMKTVQLLFNFKIIGVSIFIFDPGGIFNLVIYIVYKLCISVGESGFMSLRYLDESEICLCQCLFS